MTGKSALFDSKINSSQHKYPTMAVIQITKIQIRRGLQSEVQPENLDPGEFAFAFDTGRLFVGSHPDHEGLWSMRAIPPYEAIEVLTEGSLETFARMFDRMHRTLGPVGLVEGGPAYTRRPYLEATLEAETAVWSAVMVKRADQGTGLYDDEDTDEFLLARYSSVGAMVDYYILDTGNVLRAGRLTIVHDGNEVGDDARIVDEQVSFPKVAGNGTPIPIDDLFTTGVQFRATRVTTSPGNYAIRL